MHAGITMQHHDNAKPHISFQMQEVTENLLFTMLLHPLYKTMWCTLSPKCKVYLLGNQYDLFTQLKLPWSYDFMVKAQSVTGTET